MPAASALSRAPAVWWIESHHSSFYTDDFAVDQSVGHLHPGLRNDSAKGGSRNVHGFGRFNLA
jgi:hypothetical protein